MRMIPGLICAFLFGTLSSAAVQAQVQNCAPHEEVVHALDAKYQERQRAVGLINEEAMMEVYISRQGTWTIVVTDETGLSCILATGEAWDEMPVQSMGTGS